MNETAQATLDHAVEYHETVKRALQSLDPTDAEYYTKRTSLRLELHHAKKLAAAAQRLRQNPKPAEVNDHED